MAFVPLHWGHGASRVGTIWGPFAEILYFLVFKIDSQLLHHEGMLLVLDFGDSVSLSPQNLSHGCGSVQDVVQFIGNMGGFLSMWIFSQPYRTVLGSFICLCLLQLSGIMKFLFVCISSYLSPVLLRVGHHTSRKLLWKQSISLYMQP